MKKKMLYLASLLLLAYLGFGLYLYVNQKSFLYFPMPYTTKAYANEVIRNEGEKINFIVLNEGHKDAILYFGGNGESMALSADEIAKEFPDFTVYLMDYRGYGRSTGQASEKALYSDALKLYDVAKQKHADISVGGRSLGSGIATYVAANRAVSKLVLITPYDSIVNVAQEKFPLYPSALLLHDTYDSVSHVRNITAQTLVIMAEEDRVISKDRTQALIDAFDTQQLKVIRIQNRGHNDVSLDQGYYKAIRTFLGQQ